MISARDFLSAFKTVWDGEIAARKEQLQSAYKNDVSWTGEMLGDNGIIKKVSEELVKVAKHDIWWEWRKVDAMLGVGSFNNRLPKRILALIEHENASDVYEEMWKLLHWRCPLKVLIFYDWAEGDKSTPAREGWLKEKLDEFDEMYWEVNDFNPESQSTEYVFLIGRGTEEGVCTWFWKTIKDGQPLELTELGALERAYTAADDIGKSRQMRECKISLEYECVEPIEEHVSLHGKVLRMTDRVLDSIDSIARRSNVTIRNSHVSYEPYSES